MNRQRWDAFQRTTKQVADGGTKHLFLFLPDFCTTAGFVLCILSLPLLILAGWLSAAVRG